MSNAVQTAAVPGLGHHIYRAVCIGAACAAGSEICGEQRVEKEDTERVRYPAGAADCTGAGAVPGAAEAGDDTGERVSGWFDTIWADDLPSRAVTVYMYLRSRADREGKCFPSVRTISRDTKLSMSTVRRALDDLVNTGYIQKQPRWRANGAKSSNIYIL